MDSCRYEPELIEFAEGTLSPGRRDAIREHLSECTTCPDRLREIQAVTDSLTHRTRPAVPPPVMQRYVRALNTRFPSTNRLRRALAGIRRQWESFRETSPVLARVAHAAVWIIVGVVLGANLFSPRGTAPNRFTANTPLLTPALSTSEMESLEGFLTKTEILMLALVNSSDRDPGGQSEYSFERTIAAQLLQQAGRMEKQIGRTGDRELQDYMDRLHSLLETLTQPGAAENPHRLDGLRREIRRNNLLTESKRLHETVQNHLQQRKYVSAYKL